MEIPWNPKLEENGGISISILFFESSTWVCVWTPLMGIEPTNSDIATTTRLVEQALHVYHPSWDRMWSRPGWLFQTVVRIAWTGWGANASWYDGAEEAAAAHTLPLWLVMRAPMVFLERCKICLSTKDVNSPPGHFTAHWPKIVSSRLSGISCVKHAEERTASLAQESQAEHFATSYSNQFSFVHQWII